MGITKHSQELRKIRSSGRTSVARKFAFTKKAIDALPLPTGHQREYYRDSQGRHLALAVSTAGKKTFILYRKINGRSERITIGSYPELPIERAREKAEKMNAAVADGFNPAEQRRDAREEMTLAELFESYLDLHAKPHKKTWKDDQDMFNLYLRHWHKRKVSTLRRLDVVMLHTRIGKERGQYSANRVIELVRGLYNRAIEWGWKGENPAAKIKAFPERQRDRFLQPDELPKFFKALSEELNETLRDFFLISLLVGARRANVLSMRWSEIDWDRAIWNIAAEQAKEDQPIQVALSPVALEILSARRSRAVSPFVFPSHSKSGHLVSPKKAWARLLKRAGLTDLRIHDLRRSLASWQAITGASLPVIGKSLGHRDAAATQIYARLTMSPVHDSVSKATTAMLAAAGNPLLLGEK